MKFLLAAAAAGLAAWLYRSGRVRELARRYLTPLQPGLRRAMTEMVSAAERASRAVPERPRRVAAIQVQELPDGSWIGESAWGGRTLHEGDTEAERVIRRLVARLGALPEAERPDRVNLIRVPRAGEREESEQDLAGLLS